MIPQRSARIACVASCLTLLAPAPDAQAQYLHTGSAVNLFSWEGEGSSAQLQWQVSKSESYNPSTTASRLRLLYENAMFYSFEHQDRFPDQASTLFSLNYINDPLAFYSPGDANAPPTTINNDVPNAANSAQISFAYPGAGQPTGTPPDALLFVDNTPANNAGLGRLAVQFDGRTVYLPESPHPLGTIHVPLRDSSPSTFRPAGQPAVPYAFSPPTGSVTDAVAGAHRSQFALRATIDASTSDAFEEKGWGDVNTFAQSSLAGLLFPEMEVTGPPGAVTAPLAVYAAFEARLGRAADSRFASARFLHMLLHAAFSGETTRSQPSAVLGEDVMIVAPPYVILEWRPLSPDEDGYVAGGQTAFIRGVVKLVVDVPVGVDGTLALQSSAGTQHSLAPDESPQSEVASYLQTEWATTPSVEQVRVILPPGFGLTYIPTYGPADLLRVCRPGDHDLDGDVDEPDRQQLLAAFSGPLISANYAEPSLRQLSTFDFDGDGDVDCSDYASFRTAWSAGGSPPFYSPCDRDDDGDGMANRDDDCPATSGGVVVDARGCPRGDATADGIVSAADLPTLLDCLQGPFRQPFPPPPTLPAACLASFDFDDDGDVDFADVGSWQRLIATP
jgi:hypothetical protein